MSENQTTPPASTPAKLEIPSAVPEPQEIPSDQILQGMQRVAIIHNGQRYFLSVTRNGKLILQK